MGRGLCRGVGGGGAANVAFNHLIEPFHTIFQVQTLRGRLAPHPCLRGRGGFVGLVDCGTGFEHWGLPVTCDKWGVGHGGVAGGQNGRPCFPQSSGLSASVHVGLCTPVHQKSARRGYSAGQVCHNHQLSEGLLLSPVGRFG